MRMIVGYLLMTLQEDTIDHLCRLEKAVAKFCGSYGLLDTQSFLVVEF